MKVELNSVDGFHTLVELTEVDKPEGYYSLEFTTVFDRSRSPHERQAYRVLMSPECLAKFRLYLGAVAEGTPIVTIPKK